MKLSEFKSLIREEVKKVLVEQDTNEAMEAIEAIKKHVKILMDTDIAKEDAVLQRLLAKYTGLLGKITGYIKKKGAESAEPTEEPAEEPKRDLRKIESPKEKTEEEPEVA